MGRYIAKRLLLLVPTIIAIVLINFTLVQFVPGGPIEQIISKLTVGNISTTANVTGGGDVGADASATDALSDNYGLDPELLEDLERQFGFDKPLHERFFTMLSGYVVFDFGVSYFQDVPVLELILERLPVSMSLGLWALLIIYGVSIPLGVRKAVRDGTRFDVATSSLIFVGYAVPGFLFAIVLLVLFAGGGYLEIFPLRGLVSENWYAMSWSDRILDYLWHLCLPLIALTIGGFATLTMLTKNSFLEELGKQFVLTARSKGLNERQVMYGHVFRNAMLVVIAGFPSAFVAILFTGSLLIEIIFSIDGMGLLTYDAIIKRDYPIMFGNVYILTLVGLLMHLLSDLIYVLVDPRIDFETR
ncbi:MAG TPA: microcin ABC transporter permease [Gammaproteobacteria bacterium]|nr:microcin ABC transporter permease [Gammaproteobacteria bacterium]|tara:strand:+ start:2407 stop:3483 length:1077 start_codon:yes stop_codon:yes gene_type:complete